jgi:hypothetical protein
VKRTPVSSSNLASIGYDSASHTLEVAFLNGSVYQYSGVPEHIYQGLMAASSHGSYFDAHVKKAGYSYRRV